MASENPKWIIPLIRAIGDSGYSVEEVAYFCGTTEAEIFDIARGYTSAGPITRRNLAAVTGKKEDELFREAS
jgi:hypothetical protein